MASDEDEFILDATKAAQYIKLSKVNPNTFKLVISKTINENKDRFNLLELNKDNDDSDTTMDKQAFVQRFEGSFRPELLEAIFDCIDANDTGIVSNAALLSYTNNKPIHPRHATTQINSKWLFTTIKQMNFGQLSNHENKVTLEEMKTHFADKKVSDEIVELVFKEIDSDEKGYISMKDFFQWRERFDASKLRTWSRALSATMIFTGMEEFIQEMANDSDSFEMVEPNHPSEKEETFDQDTTANEAQILKEIIGVLDQGVDNEHQTAELARVIKASVETLKYELAEARLAENKARKNIKDTHEEAQKLQYESADQKLATKQLAKELSDIIGRNIDTDDAYDLMNVIKELRGMVSDERLDKKRLEDKMQYMEDETRRLEYNLGEARMAMTKLKRELSHTLGTHEASADDPYELTQLFAQLQHQIADERMDHMKQRRNSVQLKDNLDKINYQLADERIELLELKQKITDILDIDVNVIEDMNSLKSLLRRLQAHVDMDEDKRALVLKSEQAQMLKADEKIKQVDMEQELAKMAGDEEEDHTVDYNAITDVNQLRSIVKSLKAELRNSRTDQVAVSETKSHLEVQTFDLQTKLVSEKKKYKKLLRMSQNLSGFDPNELQTTEEVTAAEAVAQTIDLNQYQPKSDPDDDDEDNAPEEEEEEEVSDNESVHSVNIKPFVEHKEEWNKNDDDDDDATHVRSNSTLEGVIAKLKAKIQEQHHTIERLETETTEMNAQNESLRTRNRTHRRRESEVFTAIGDDAKNVVQTFEELEESRKKIENDQLELAFLQAEKQRMAIAYDHQKENATKYRQESAVLKNKIKEMETSTRKRTQSRADELQTAKTRLDSLEKKAKVSENMELELAFYKAEKQRMEVKIEFQDRNQKQTKELNKELQKAVKSEKEKVRRLSQSFNVSDIEELNKLPQVQQAKEDDWKNEVDKLKEELAAEQMEKTVLQREKNDLMAKLTNVESTQAHEDEDSEEDDDGNASPLSGDENASRPEVQMAAEPPKRSEDIETLKFKLANAELQNAQLKRRVSIAGIEKEQLSQLWEQPRVTIQMVSEFIERLPLKHKEKIWARHATGQYIAKNKILHTLHSFVALCIKIKDRTAVAPSRHDIEKRLVPFADVIRQRTENANGMALDEFNNELHYWILEPVSGLIMTDGEQKQWLDEIDLLRDELMKAQEAKRRIERKSQMDLTVLLDKMKELDQDPSDQIDELEEQVEELHTIVNELQDEIKQLTVENIALRQGRDKARESEDDEEEEEEEVVPQLIDASQQKTLSEYRELQNEQEFAEERLEYSRNDSGVTKSTAYVGWKNKATNAKKEIETLQRERTKTTEIVDHLQKTVDELRQAKQADSSVHESQIEQFQSEIAKFKKKYQESDRIRKDSISTLHDNLFAKLLEAEAEHEEMVADYKQQIGRLTKANKAFEQSMTAMATTKVDTISKLENTIQKLRKTIAALSTQCERLSNRMNRLENRTAVQHITSSLSSWIG
eukprot:541911_1